MSIAFFDLDRTLLAVNSGSLWVKSEYRLGHLSTRKLLKAVFVLVKYHLGFADIEQPLRDAVADLKGKPEAAIVARTLRFYDAMVASQYRQGAAAALARHAAQGEACVLLTASSNYLSEPVVAALGLDGYLANAFHVDPNGHFTGTPHEPLCFGAGKVTHARRYADARGVDLKDCAFYTDSISDLPMLEAVGRPVCVGPDPKLKKIAAQRGWPTEDWGGAVG